MNEMIIIILLLLILILIIIRIRSANPKPRRHGAYTHSVSAAIAVDPTTLQILCSLQHPRVTNSMPLHARVHVYIALHIG
jgi:hypothetical protein